MTSREARFAGLQGLAEAKSNARLLVNRSDRGQCQTLEQPEEAQSLIIRLVMWATLEELYRYPHYPAG